MHDVSTSEVGWLELQTFARREVKQNVLKYHSSCDISDCYSILADVEGDRLGILLVK
jgi:hypothetical protein